MSKDYSLGFLVGLIKAVSGGEPEVYIVSMEYEKDNKRFVITLNNGNKLYTPFVTDTYTKDEIDKAIKVVNDTKADNTLANVTDADFKAKAESAGFTPNKGIRGEGFLTPYYDTRNTIESSKFVKSADGVVTLNITLRLLLELSANYFHIVAQLPETVNGATLRTSVITAGSAAKTSDTGVRGVVMNTSGQIYLCTGNSTLKESQLIAISFNYIV